METTLELMAEELKKYSEYRIVYHIRPDGDCIGSAYALALALKKLGAKCEVVGKDPVPLIHRFMTDAVVADEMENPVWICVDTATPERAGTFADEHYTFCIDHHHGNTIQADFKYVEADCGACSEIILKLVKLLGIEITTDIADLLYTALVTDTMCFRTSDTDEQSFLTAAELARLGADVYGIGRRNMFIKSPQRIEIEKRLSDSYHFTCDKQILTGIITLQDLKEADILDSELEGINSQVEQIEGVKIGVTIRELPDGTTRCSMRSCGDIPANEICAEHGGGGHKNAAACILDTDVFKARDIMEETCKKYL